MQTEMRPKLQALLADRFQLKLHREMRERPIYELVVSKRGSKLQTVNGNFRGLHVGASSLVGEGATVEMLAGALGNKLGRTVLDRTGLAGIFNFKLEWAVDSDLSSVPGGGAVASADPNRPSIFTAVEDQLGLKLESAKGLVEVLVIDHGEKPSDN